MAERKTWQVYGRTLKTWEEEGRGRGKSQKAFPTENGDSIGAKPPQGLAGQAAGCGLCFWTQGSHGRASGQGATWLDCAWEGAITEKKTAF